MFNWKAEIKGEYLRFLYKTLSTNEETYYHYLTNGLGNILEYSIDYVNNHVEDLNSIDDEISFADFGEVINDDFITEILISILLNNKNTALTPIRKFYQSGVRIASEELGKQPSFYKSDQQALNKLENYIGTVNTSINNEYVNGVKKVLYDNHNESTQVINTELMNLQNTPINTHISPVNRCLFMTKTEYARSINTGLLQTYANYGVETFDWITSGLPNVCKYCLANEKNNPYSLEEIIRLLPVHSNCICSVKAKIPIHTSLQKNPPIINLTPNKNFKK